MHDKSALTDAGARCLCLGSKMLGFLEKVPDYAAKAWPYITFLYPRLLNRARLGFASDLHQLLECAARLQDAPSDLVEVCDRMARVWMSVSNERDIHLTIKLIEEGKRVITVGRSATGLRGRPLHYGNGEEAPPIEATELNRSTAFKTVTGEHPRMCFSGKRLPTVGTEKYENNRPNFGRYLQSTAVFPIYVPNGLTPMGFLTLDSADPKGFRRFPDFFETPDLQSYNSALERCACFHLGRGLARIAGDLWWRWHRREQDDA